MIVSSWISVSCRNLRCIREGMGGLRGRWSIFGRFSKSSQTHKKPNWWSSSPVALGHRFSASNISIHHSQFKKSKIPINCLSQRHASTSSKCRHTRVKKCLRKNWSRRLPWRVGSIWRDFVCDFGLLYWNECFMMDTKNVEFLKFWFRLTPRLDIFEPKLKIKFSGLNSFWNYEIAGYP